MYREEVLSGWGNIPKSKSKVIYLRDPEDFNGGPAREKIIARGWGRSYADQATNTDHIVLKTEKYNRFISFDSQLGVLECESGVTLEDIIMRFAPEGWFPAINPGTKYITIGGAIANDVHGKAHHADGSFVNCVIDFTILLADGKILTASREINSDLFWGNFGGLGLLGTILSAKIKLKKIETTYFKQRSIVAFNLEEMLDFIDESDKDYKYSVAWIDSLAKGKNLGKGVLIIGNEAKIEDLPAKLRQQPLKISGKPKVSVPFYFPSYALNTFTVSMLNKVLHYRQKAGTGFAHYESFFYPLDMIDNWNRGYGKRGFVQYQFVVPIQEGKLHINRILKEITASGCVPFLNVLKRFGKGQGILSFPYEGYTFAIDFPITPQLKEFAKKLDSMVLEAGGRVYLGKDALLDENTFKAMYPQYKEWLQIKERYDPTNLYSSDLARRIGLELK